MKNDELLKSLKGITKAHLGRDACERELIDFLLRMFSQKNLADAHQRKGQPFRNGVAELSKKQRWSGKEHQWLLVIRSDEERRYLGVSLEQLNPAGKRNDTDREIVFSVPEDFREFAGVKPARKMTEDVEGTLSLLFDLLLDVFPDLPKIFSDWVARQQEARHVDESMLSVRPVLDRKRDEIKAHLGMIASCLTGDEVTEWARAQPKPRKKMTSLSDYAADSALSPDGFIRWEIESHRDGRHVSFRMYCRRTDRNGDEAMLCQSDNPVPKLQDIVAVRESIHTTLFPLLFDCFPFLKDRLKQTAESAAAVK